MKLNHDLLFTISFTGGFDRMRTTVTALILLVSTLVIDPRLIAQEPHAASQSAIDAALQEHTATAEADREAVLRVLQHSDVARLAGQLGLDLKRAESAIATLEGQELSELAARARVVDQALAGGQRSITITTTMIIIGLLLLILLIVALK
jgi:hypothetical protein